MERMTGLARLRFRLPTRPRPFQQFTGLLKFALRRTDLFEPLGFLPQNGADDGARTRYLHLGKVALYQMSYIRKLVPSVGIEPTTRGFSVLCSTN